MHAKGASLEKLEAKFKEADPNLKGEVTSQQFMKLLGDNLALSDDEIAALVSVYDSKSEHGILYFDFLRKLGED